MSLARALGDIIMQEAQGRGRSEVQKAGLIPNAIVQGGDVMQGALNQMSFNKTRGLQDERMGLENKGRKLEMDAAEKEARDEEEVKMLLLAIPDGPDAMQKRVETFVKFYQARDPKKAMAMKKALMDQDVAMSEIEKNEASAMASRAAAVREREGGNVVAPGGAYIPFGETMPSFTNPALPLKESSAGAGKYVDIDKGDGKGVRRYQYNTQTDTYDKDLGAPPPKDVKGDGERKPYGPKTFQTGYDNAGNPVAFWVDPVNETMKPAPIKFGRTEQRDIAQGTQTVLQGVDITLPVLKELQTDLVKLNSGPAIGRLRSFNLSKLGGMNLEPEIVAILTKLGRLRSDQIFGEGGKTLTATERELIEPYTIGDSDTLGTAMAKLPELLKRTQRIKESRLKMMNTRTKSVYESRGGGAPPANDKAARIAQIKARLAELDKADAKSK